MRQPSPHPRSRRAALVVLRWVASAYAALLAALTLLPIRFMPELAHYRNNHKPQLVPVWPILRDVGDRYHPVTTMLQAAGNVGLFVPFGFLLPLLWPRLATTWRVLGVACATSVAIETIQFTMPGIRRSDVDDVLANTLGAAIGWALLRLAERRLHRADRPTFHEMTDPDLLHAYEGEVRAKR